MGAYIAITISKHTDESKTRFKSYELTMDNEEKVWITNDKGEGGQFSCEKLYNAIDKFFNDNY